MDIEWLIQAKERNITTIQITDLGMNQQPVDYTIDASIEQLFPFDKKKQVLIGPDYTLLHHKFRHFNKVRRKYRKRVKNIFSFPGWIGSIPAIAKSGGYFESSSI